MMPNRLADLPDTATWASHSNRPKARLREMKRTEAEDRNAHTAPERRRKARRNAGAR